MFYDIATSDPINLFPEGRVLDKLPGYRIYTKRHKNHDTLENLQIIKLEGNRAVQFIRARTAKIERKPGPIGLHPPPERCQSRDASGRREWCRRKRAAAPPWAKRKFPSPFGIKVQDRTCKRRHEINGSLDC